jgi:hypothetical protein
VGRATNRGYFGRSIFPCHLLHAQDSMTLKSGLEVFQFMSEVRNEMYE